MTNGTECTVASNYLNSVIEGTKFTNCELSEAISKWYFLFMRTSARVAAVTDSSIEDVISELLIPIVRLAVTYESEQYRYEGRVYDLVGVQGSILHLKTPEFSQLKTKRDFLIPENLVEKINKASLSALVYHKINQTSKLILRNHFTQKRGYTVSGSRKGVAKLRGNVFDGSCKSIVIKEVVKVKEVSMSEELGDDSTLGDMIASTDYNQESYSEALFLARSIKKGLSKEAIKVFDVLVHFPKLPELEIKDRTGLSIKQVKFSKREIQLRLDKILDKKFKSVYSPYAIYKGNYFFIKEDDGTRIRLEDFSKKYSFYVDKSTVDIDNLKYRTPVHLRTSLV